MFMNVCIQSRKGDKLNSWMVPMEMAYNSPELTTCIAEQIELFIPL